MVRVDLRENEFMEQFVGQDHINSNDVQFWYKLLSCSFNFMRVQDPTVVAKTLDPYLVLLSLNNNQSQNIGSLLRVFLDRVTRIKSPDGQSTTPHFVYQSFNALYLIRTICKNYIENSGEEQLIKALQARVDPAMTQQVVPPPLPSTSPTPSTPPQKIEVSSGETMLDHYISNLIAIIVDIPLSDSTYLLQVESINALLVLLSVQMYSVTPSNQSVIYKSLMQKKCSIHALILTKTLLNNFLQQYPMPQESGSIIFGLASGLWKVLTLGYGSGGGRAVLGLDDDDSEGMPLLSKQSLLLLNILTNHYTTDKNPYREALVSCQDCRYNLSDPMMAVVNANNDAMATATTSKSALMANSIKIDFQQLYETICKHLHNDQVALILYLLLHSNQIFRPYILTTASKDLDKLVMPLLRILYLSIERGSHHIYMVLIIFIILSEETAFNQAIHKITVKGVPWYKDRIPNELSLGSLMTLIIVRSFQYNTFKIKDKFLHTNLFATLANLSNHFQNLHHYVSQRLVEFLERLSKRYLLVTKPQQNDKTEIFPGEISNQKVDVLNFNNPLAKALATDTQKQNLQDASSIELDSTSTQVSASQTDTKVTLEMTDHQETNVETTLVSPKNHQITEDLHILNEKVSEDFSSNGNSTTTADNIVISMDDAKQDIMLVEEVLRMLLEVINNSLATQMRENPDLIYTLLYNRRVFSSLLSSHQSFYTMVINIERILTYFYNKIEAFERSLCVEEIKDLIQRESQEWNYDENRDPNTRLLFHYVEDEQPEEFFIPYIWTRIYYSSGIPWNSKRIVLFNPDDI